MQGFGSEKNSKSVDHTQKCHVIDVRSHQNLASFNSKNLPCAHSMFDYLKDFQNLKTVIEFKKYGSLVTHWVLKGQSKQLIKLNSISFHQYTSCLAATAILVVSRFNLCNPQSRQILCHVKYSQIWSVLPNIIRV